MASRRRLSHNNECLGELLEEDDEDDEEQRLLMLRKVKSNRNSIGGRMSISSNRSSLGQEQSAEEQNRIAEMYKTVIKMSSEDVSYLTRQHSNSHNDKIIIENQ